MDPRAILETVVAVALTPVLSISMALAVVAGILFLARRANRG